MHQVIYSIRSIAPADLPVVREIDGTERPATDAELLNLGIVHVDDDLYSCVHQERRDPDTLAWAPHGRELPGDVVSAGSLKRRYAQLPPEIAGKLLRAQVIRGTLGNPAAALAEENVAYVATVLADAVGEVDGAPLIDLAGSGAVLEEAQRLVQIEGNGIERQLVSMAAVTSDDVVEVTDLIPHSWHGESPH